MNEQEKKLIKCLEVCLEQILEYSPDNQYIIGTEHSVSVEELKLIIKEFKASYNKE